MAIKGITQRWVLNSLGLILAILVVLELGMAFIVRAYYYNDVLMVLNNQITTVRDSFSKYSGSNSLDFRLGAQQIVENFALKEKMELIVFDRQGVAITSSSGFTPDPVQPKTDYTLAVSSDNAMGNAVFTLTSGENVMAVTSLLDRDGSQTPRAIRLVVSLEPTDNQIFVIMAVLLAVGVAIIFFVIMSGSYFIGSIVNPVRNIGQTARRIALGDFDARLEKKYNDEIGDLCDTINYMATELAATERMKNDFISSVSHELRTPLTAIKGWGETLMAPSIDQETFNKGMSVIVRESERLSGIVEELLDFSRIQSGRLTLKIERMDILAELGEAVVMFRERSQRDNIELIYHEPEILPPIQGDHNRLKQVFVNILDNAFKYSDPGGRVRVEASETTDDYIQVVISDSGCGISSIDLPKIKERFYKANHTRRGSGIGLAVVDEIISLHKGSLDIRSTEGKGTDVIIRLPIERKSAPPKPAEPEQAEETLPEDL